MRYPQERVLVVARWSAEEAAAARLRGVAGDSQALADWAARALVVQWQKLGFPFVRAVHLAKAILAEIDLKTAVVNG